MNVDRRITARLCMELIKECSDLGEMSDSAFAALDEALKIMKQNEFWQLRNQSRHEGKNDPTDKQIAISRVALPALEEAAKALAADDWEGVLAHLTVAVETDGTVVKKRLRKSRG